MQGLVGYADLKWLLYRRSLHRRQLTPAAATLQLKSSTSAPSGSSSELQALEASAPSQAPAAAFDDELPIHWKPVCCLIQRVPIIGIGMEAAAIAAHSADEKLNITDEDQKVSWCGRCARDVATFAKVTQWGYP